MANARKNKRRGKGEGGIHRRKSDGRYMAYISWREAGKHRMEVKYSWTEAEAVENLQCLREQKNQLVGNSRRAKGDSKMTVAAYLADWLESIKLASKRATWDKYESTTRCHLIPRLAMVRLDRFTSDDVQQLYADMLKAGVSPWNQFHAATILHTAIEAAVPRLIGANPCNRVPRPRQPQTEMEIWDLDQVVRFLEAAQEDRFYALYVLALTTSMRQGEMLGLLWPDIDWNQSCLHVQRALHLSRGCLWVEEPKTRKSRRRIELAQVTMEALAGHRKRMLAEGHGSNDHPVFCNRVGKWMHASNLTTRSNYGKIVVQAGLPHIRFHDLRHTAISLLFAAGENTKVISERAGHSRIEITQNTYTHLLPTMQQAAAKRIDTMFAGLSVYKDGLQSEAKTS
jgi:integrase